MAATAKLIADRGEAAVEPEFFRSREFFEAEGVTHSLSVEAGAAGSVIPLVVRAIPGARDALDAVSPYSYPGGRVSGEPIDPAAVDFSATGLVSAFVRDRLGDPPALAGGTQRSVVLAHDPAIDRKSRMSDRQQIRKNEAAGYEVSHLPGPETTAAARAGFLDAYLETMRTVAATDRYMFDAAYFDLLFGSRLSRMFTVTGPEREVAAAALVVESDGFLHYYLSGTADSHRRRAPSKNLIVAVSDLADELGMPMNLGGGLAPGDGLEVFKRGFANRELPFRTHEIICDRDAYRRLAAGRDPAAGFFPSYRAG